HGVKEEGWCSSLGWCTSKYDATSDGKSIIRMGTDSMLKTGLQVTRKQGRCTILPPVKSADHTTMLIVNRQVTPRMGRQFSVDHVYASYEKRRLHEKGVLRHLSGGCCSKEKDGQVLKATCQVEVASRAMLQAKQHDTSAHRTDLAHFAEVRTQLPCPGLLVAKPHLQDVATIWNFHNADETAGAILRVTDDVQCLRSVQLWHWWEVDVGEFHRPSVEREQHFGLLMLPIDTPGGAAQVDAAPGYWVEQGELILAGEEEDPGSTVSDAPLLIVLETREIEIAAADGGGKVTVGADLGAVESTEGHIFMVDEAHKAPEERGRRMEVAELAEEFFGGCQVALSHAGGCGAGDRGKRRKAMEDVNEDVVAKRINGGGRRHMVWLALALVVGFHVSRWMEREILLILRTT
ncbi:hypothetical protein EJB05_40508, partial [Eragrostis curvula]